MKLLIDTDTASDDAVALLMALRHSEAEVVAITTVAGNVEVEQGTSNALYVTELCEADVPVYVGVSRPLLREPRYAHRHHGGDGLGDVGFRPERARAATGHAVDVLISTVREHAGEIVLVTLGPLTNVALALRHAPDIASGVRRCIVMGGAACTVGNVTPAAEFNIWVDPDAARIVFDSGLPIEMVGWELCRGEAGLDENEMRQIREIGTPYARFALDCNVTAIEANRTHFGEPGLTLPDPVAMAVALDPAIAVRTGRHHVGVETTGELTRGMTVVDALGVTGHGPNATVVWEIDVSGWKEALRRALAP